MVVAEPPLFADIEVVLMVALADLAETDTVTPDDDIDVGIRINRVGGTDDGITDYPRVEISCYAPTRNEAQQLAERVRRRMLALGGEAFVVDGQKVTIDFCRTDTPPEGVPYDNPDRDRVVSWYLLGLMPPRPI